jgi:hypothetical protein
LCPAARGTSLCLTYSSILRCGKHKDDGRDIGMDSLEDEIHNYETFFNNGCYRHVFIFHSISDKAELLSLSVDLIDDSCLWKNSALNSIHLSINYS